MAGYTEHVRFMKMTWGSVASDCADSKDRERSCMAHQANLINAIDIRKTSSLQSLLNTYF